MYKSQTCIRYGHAKLVIKFLFFVIFAFYLHPDLRADEESTRWDCQASREYVTVYNYLREETPLELNEEERRETAWQVAKGCDRSAWRFIQVMKTLMRADINPRHALQTAVELSHGDETRVKAFLTIFKLAHASDFLDLNLLQSLDLARSLSIDFLQLPHWLEDDFRKLVLFCVSEQALNLPRPQCGKWAADLIQATAKKLQNGQVLKIGVATPFFQGFEFLTGERGPQITSGDALQLLSQLLLVSPYTIANLIEAYQFATSDKGLKLDRSQGLEFSAELAKLTVHESEAKQEDMRAQNRKLN
ncbi:MAG: hypothetical protein ACOH5I_18085 [Oligoflexus sp.]